MKPITVITVEERNALRALSDAATPHSSPPHARLSLRCSTLLRRQKKNEMNGSKRGNR